MPALLILAVISWLLGSGKSRANADAPPIFTTLELRPPRRFGVFAISVAVHAFCLILVFVISNLFSAADDDFLPRQFAAHALVIRLPEHIYLAPAAGRTFPANARLAHSPRVSVRHKDLGKYADAEGEAKFSQPLAETSGGAQSSLFSMMIPPPMPPAQAEPRKFELPDLPVHATAAQTLLQAELPPDLSPSIEKRLPQLVFWDADTAKPPDRPVVPGNLTPKPQSPKLDSTPRLEAPNRESTTSDFRVASMSIDTPPALTLPSATTTMPVRLLEPTKDPTGPSSIDPFTGHPVHVMALSPDPAPLTDALKALFIPAGNQLARLPGAPPVFGFPGLGDGSGGPDGASGGLGAGGIAGDTGSYGGAVPEGVDGASSAPELVHSLPGDGRLFGLLSPPGLNGTPLRILHPGNGVFDVVVVQSSTSDTFPETAETLSGRPIYTVYLQVGAPKEWILQYCVPNMAGPVQTGGLVNLGNPEPMAAPYPMVTVRPPEDWEHGSDYLLVHGFLDEAGHFRNMTILASQNPRAPATDALLEYLAYWEFRPAVVDGKPVKVEVVLAVPPDRVS